MTIALPDFRLIGGSEAARYAIHSNPFRRRVIESL
jgi:hypothetical protein